MRARPWSVLIVVFAVFAMVGAQMVAPRVAESGGCILRVDQYPLLNMATCIEVAGARCYECWYPDEQNDGFQYCTESADGTVSNCEFFRDMRSAP